MVDRLIVLDRTLRLLAEMVDVGPDEISAALARRPVLVSVGRTTSVDLPTQAALATIVTLTVRSGLRVNLDVPPAMTGSPLLEPGPLPDALVCLGDSILPGSVIAAPGDTPDLEIAIGAGVPHMGHRTIYLGAKGQVASFARKPVAWAPLDPPTAVAAAGLAAGEAVRHTVRDLPPAALWVEEILKPIHSASFTLPRLPEGWIELGSIDMISAGAISDAVMWTLRARGRVRGHGRVFDDGRYDLTNVNRYVELGREVAAAGAFKARHLARSAPPDITLEAVLRRFGPADIRGAAETIIVGADDVEVRWMAQKAASMWLGIGATSHNEVRVTEHRPNGPCAGCAHPHLGDRPTQPIPTSAPVSFWAGFVLALRLFRAMTTVTTTRDDEYATFYPLSRPGVSHAGSCQYHPSCPLDPSHRTAA